LAPSAAMLGCPIRNVRAVSAVCHRCPLLPAIKA
jgi:hypothetical protein